MESFYIFDLFLPELTLTLAVLLLVLISAFVNPNSKSKLVLRAIGVFMFLVASIIIFNDEYAVISDDAFVWCKYTQMSKVIVLMLSGFMAFMIGELAKEDNSIKPETAVFIGLSTIGMMLLISSNSTLMVYMSVELMTLPLYIMAASNIKSIKSVEAGLKYFILSTIASCIFLFGASLLYGFTQSLSLSANFAEKLDILQDSSIVESDMYSVAPIAIIVGIMMIISTICFKLSAAPFHVWTPDVYGGANLPMTAFFSIVPKFAVLTFFARLLYTAFVEYSEQWGHMIMFVSLLSLFVGNLGALMQTEIKKLLAYSTIGQIGFILLGIASQSEEGVNASIIYAAIYVVVSLGVFGILMLIKDNSTSYFDEINSLGGLARAHPIVAVGLAICMLSLAGIPPLAGFFAKFYVLQALIKQEFYCTAVYALVMAVISAYYYLNIIKLMYFSGQKTHLRTRGGAPVISLIACTATALNVLYIIRPALLTEFVERIVVSFVDLALL